MAWQLNGTPDTLGAPADNITISDLTSLKFNVYLSHLLQSGQIQPLLRLNNDSANNYAHRSSDNGAADATTINTSGGRIINAITADCFSVILEINISSQEKLIINQTVSQQASGAGTAPSREESVIRWSNTSVPSTMVNLFNVGAGDYNTTSNLSAIATD